MSRTKGGPPNKSSAEWLAILDDYERIHGHFNPQVRETHKKAAVGKWMSNCRYRFLSGRLDPDLKAELLRRGASWSIYEAKFEERLRRYDALCAKHGPDAIHRNSVNREARSLAEWLMHCRSDMLRGNLPVARVKALSRRNITVSFKLPFDEALVRLDTYSSETGHMNVPATYVDDKGFALGLWLNRCRRNHGRGLLPENQVDALDRRGFDWKLPGRGEVTPEYSTGEYSIGPQDVDAGGLSL